VNGIGLIKTQRSTSSLFCGTVPHMLIVLRHRRDVVVSVAVCNFVFVVLGVLTFALLSLSLVALILAVASVVRIISYIVK